jgi:hypothetical protein
MAHIWRTTKAAEEVARSFSAFCKNNNVITRGYVRVGRTPRGLRGLIAARDIAKDDNVIIVPDHAIVTCFEALRNESFVRAVESGGAKVDFTYSSLSARVGSTFLYDHHIALALVLAHSLLAADKADRFGPLVDYLPRGEADFGELTVLLERAIDHATIFNTMGMALAAHHHISPQDMRTVVVWALTMVISRTIPIEHRATVAKLASGTPLEHEILEREKGVTTSFHVAALVPLIDLINHDENDNVAVAVPEVELKYSRCVIARSVRPIAKGEEITMRYGGVHDTNMLRIFYGITNYVPAPVVPALPSK